MRAEVLDQRVFDIPAPGQFDLFLGRAQQWDPCPEREQQTQCHDRYQNQVPAGDAHHGSCACTRSLSALLGRLFRNPAHGGCCRPLGSADLLNRPPACALLRLLFVYPGIGKLQDIGSLPVLFRYPPSPDSLLLNTCDQTMMSLFAALRAPVVMISPQPVTIPSLATAGYIPLSRNIDINQLPYYYNSRKSCHFAIQTRFETERSRALEQ